MGAIDLRLSRISKLFVDRDEASTEAALARRREFGVTLRCGGDLAESYMLQVAALTAASIAIRCFPGAVRAIVPPELAEAPLLVWPQLKLSFGHALRDLLGADAPIGAGDPTAHMLLFGDAAPAKGALRVTFDGWIAKVGPAAETSRLAERAYCPLAGVAAAALAVSELFLCFAGVNVEATRRAVGLSLWRPDLDINDPAALGVQVEYLPRELWVLGLGHLGNAYLWTLATLPYPKPGEVAFSLCDFDTVEPENVETGVIFAAADERRLKTRSVCGWLERRSFQTRLVERRFDATFRRHEKEPALALCGFDSNPARRDLGTAKFLRIVEGGLGGTAGNFDTVSLHTLPNPRSPAELWPDLSKEEEERRAAYQERVARENPGYECLGEDDCGRFELAGKSVAVPFVGVAAGTLVVAEVLRLLHGGPAFTNIKFSLGTPNRRAARMNGNYSGQDTAGLNFVRADRHRIAKV
jgi:molybdopterin/thiamine biosynthesis adenylyltransferase